MTPTIRFDQGDAAAGSDDVANAPSLLPAMTPKAPPPVIWLVKPKFADNEDLAVDENTDPPHIMTKESAHAKA